MRKYFTELKRIIVVLLSVVNICCFACGCERGWDWQGPYHHAAVVSTPKKTIVAGKKVYSLINEKLYKHNDGQLELIEFYRTSYGGLRISDVASDGENLFLVSYGSIFSLINKELTHIVYLDSDDLISIKDTAIETLLVENEEIYYVAFKERIGDKYKYEVCSYDLRTKTGETIYEFFNFQNPLRNVDSKIIEVEDRLLFMDERMNLCWVDSLQEQNRIVPRDILVVNDGHITEKIAFELSFSFVLEEKIARLEVVEQGVEFQYLDKVYEYPIQTNNLRLYPIVKVIDNKVYFAVNDWSQKEDCERTDCVCRYNASMLIVFDLANEQFSLQKQIGEKDVFIDFSKDECIYYSKDSVYKNDSIIKMVGEIQPGVFYKIVEGVPRPVYELKLAYFGGNLNYVLYENIDSLSTEYA